MKIFKYRLKIIDPLIYSKGGLSGSITPSFIHATALNCSVAFSIGLNKEHQPYIVSEYNGGRNIPRYKNSYISEDFYFTPAKPEKSINLIPDLVKGENDGFIRIGYGKKESTIPRPTLKTKKCTL